MTAANRETLILRLADTAALLREARRAGQVPPLVCPNLHAAGRQWTIGTLRFCLACSRPVQPADELHRAVTRALRQCRRPQRRRRRRSVAAIHPALLTAFNAWALEAPPALYQLQKAYINAAVDEIERRGWSLTEEHSAEDMRSIAEVIAPRILGDFTRIAPPDWSFERFIRWAGRNPGLLERFDQ